MKCRLSVMIPLLITGCVHLGDAFEQHPLPPGTPEISAILLDLAENSDAVSSFRASGKFILKSPELDTIHVLRQSSMYFERPARLEVTGRKIAAVTVLRLWCDGPEFLLEFPTENQFFYSPEGESLTHVNFRVSPSDIVREMFLPEDWRKVDPRDLRILQYTPETRTAELVLFEGGLRKRPRRRLIVQGAPWILLRSERLDSDGRVLAVTTRSDYHELDSIRFPTRIETDFPTEEAWMHFELRRIYLNVPADTPFPDIAAHAEELREKGYEEVQPEESGKGAE